MGWHFLCIIWNRIAGKVTYFYDGNWKKAEISNTMLKLELPAEKNYSIDLLSDDTGKLTQLNIWDSELSTENIVAMSAGGFNVHGNVLSWGRFKEYVSNESINFKTDIYLPGKRNPLN